ncbi:response regulator transcription factor [Devosia sp. PTR5]|uniref:Response regulator transcription factor n=2 Tax=Devosia oryzisoli TaxID=2774138 RepID=A0A927ITJ4_9HYPH|nr:response regulator transcription factor [Devosia oryzisoli]
MSELIGDCAQLLLVGEASDAAGAMLTVQQSSPEVLLMDFSMPGDVVGTIERIVLTYPDTRVIIITAFSSVDSAVKALDAGAMGFVLKGGPCSEVIEAIDAVTSGQMYVARQYAAEVLMELRRRDRAREVSASVRLNLRERQIVGQLMHARTNREIAESLKLSEKTVKHYMTNLMVKLNARNRVEVVLAAQHSLDA